MEPRMDPAVATTTVRLVLALPLAYAAYVGAHGWVALLFLLFWALDILDGWVARVYECESEFGSAFDFYTDWAAFAMLGAALFLGGHIATQALVLALIPLVLLAIAVGVGKRMVRRHVLGPGWSRINGVAGYLFLLCLIIGQGWALGLGWLLLAYLFFVRARELALIVRASRVYDQESHDQEYQEEERY